MSNTYTVHAAKTQLSRLIARAERGETVLIARGTEVVAKLTAMVEVQPKRQFGAMRGRARVTAAFFEPLPDGELAAWEK